MSDARFTLVGGLTERDYAADNKAMFVRELRDRFALAAMQGRLTDVSVNMTHEQRAKDAYAMADAMLAERK